MRMGIAGICALSLLTAACGSNESQRAATGGLTGAGVGAVVGGPVGAVVGGAAGAAGGAVAPEGADTLTGRLVGKEKSAARNELDKHGLGPNSSQASAQHTRLVKDAQTELQHEGLYNGKIDGIAGPETRKALAAYQNREGLQQTARLDQPTMERMNLASETSRAARSNRNAPATRSGSSTPPASTTPPNDANAPNGGAATGSTSPNSQ